jgi:hypothetical protein
MLPLVTGLAHGDEPLDWLSSDVPTIILLVVGPAWHGRRNTRFGQLGRRRRDRAKGVLLNLSLVVRR